VSNVSIRQRLQRYGSVVSNIARGKLQLFGHICRMDDDRLVKTVMLGMVDGDRIRGWPPRWLVDGIIDWCACTLPATVHRTMNRTKWNEKIDDVAGLSGPSGLWVHRWMDGWMDGYHRRGMRSFGVKFWVSHCN